MAASRTKSRCRAPPSRRRWEHAPRSAPQRRRIDLKLCRRDYSVEAETAHAYSQAGSGALPRGSYHAIGIYGPKTEDNVGSLWRSALQMGAGFIFTINARFPMQRLKTDTLQTHCRIPYIPHDKWSNFVEAAPLGAKWVAVEMGGEPLDSFEHPERALYILGSEDTGLPQSVIDACHERVALPSVRYSSYNVAVAGSIVLYDRLAKERRRDAEANGTHGRGVRVLLQHYATVVDRDRSADDTSARTRSAVSWMIS